ncbi:FHA domain-containing protein [Psychrobacter sp.]|uniref:FHA domain-containing protein n=1 Tax=Psychrobacter sp. TaxID=56811 RepID=UPI0026471E47|nr:FHA domain-containing protein [Psychrobacter sp.]MDN6308026.1 FHA domain-containing protein [Psychrobacter sp.]
MNNTDSSETTENTETWHLNALTEALGDLTLPVSDSLSVGRGSDNDVVLGSKQISRNHALLSVSDGQIYVKDLGSSNGTFINDQRVEGDESSLLQADDTVGFASFTFRVIAPVAAQTSSAQAAPVVEKEPDVREDVGAEPLPVEPAAQEPVTTEPVGEESVDEELVDEEPAAEEPIVKETGIEEMLPAREDKVEPEPTGSLAAPITESDNDLEPTDDTAVASPVKAENTTPSAVKEEMLLKEEAPAEQPAKPKEQLTAPEEPALSEEPVTQPERNKTTKTTLQEEADPDILRAKQAASAQFSGTANLEQSRDLGTEGNNAMDQELNNPAHTEQAEKSASGGWFIWVFVAILIIGLAIWFFSMNGA